MSFFSWKVQTAKKRTKKRRRRVGHMSVAFPRGISHLRVLRHRASLRVEEREGLVHLEFQVWSSVVFFSLFLFDNREKKKKLFFALDLWRRLWEEVRERERRFFFPFFFFAEQTSDNRDEQIVRNRIERCASVLDLLAASAGPREHLRCVGGCSRGSNEAETRERKTAEAGGESAVLFCWRWRCWR